MALAFDCWLVSGVTDMDKEVDEVAVDESCVSLMQSEYGAGGGAVHPDWARHVSGVDPSSLGRTLS